MLNQKMHVIATVTTYWFFIDINFSTYKRFILFTDACGSDIKPHIEWGITGLCKLIYMNNEKKIVFEISYRN